MWELDYKESWVLKNWCFWPSAECWRIDVFELFESPLDCKETQPVNPRGNQSCIFIGRTDAEAETPILWSPDVKNWLLGKRPWCWERLKAGGEGEDRGRDGWMASLTTWTWVWTSSGSWWWTGKSGVLESMGSPRGKHDCAPELNWTEDFEIFCTCRLIFSESLVISLYKHEFWVLSCFSHVQLFATSGTVAIRLPCPWDSPDKNTGVGHSLLQLVSWTQGSNPCL